jgi:hypothetical protein
VDPCARRRDRRRGRPACRRDLLQRPRAPSRARATRREAHARGDRPSAPLSSPGPQSRRVQANSAWLPTRLHTARTLRRRAKTDQRQPPPGSDALIAPAFDGDEPH